MCLDLPTHCHQLREVHRYTLADQASWTPRRSLPRDDINRVGLLRSRSRTISNSAETLGGGLHGLHLFHLFRRAVYRHVWSVRNDLRDSSSSRSRVCPELAAATIHREIRVAGTVALVTGLFMVAWFPFFVVTVVATYDLERLPEPPGLLRLIAFVKALHYTNSAINPIVYGYRNTEMRKTMRSVALKWCRSSRGGRHLACKLG
ncbi:hypothetical protein OS493_012799 [Desmophyllum pertusum]|uniref:G-protein coupled receptors family 1 profile domain-containing protein n=1 Tax=Desmophyllum pertusum TaxID=174260 RepID=A0A9X0CXX8_9CNID|nr:hypothetical protein OS493_012799 [Desmophyllum pertusum]